MNQRLEQLTKLQQTDPADPFLTYAIALEHVKAESHDEAIAWLDKTIELDGQYCYAYFQKAKMLSEKDESEQARQVLEFGIHMAKEAGDEKAQRELTELFETM